MASTDAAKISKSLLFTLKIFPTSKIIFDLIFFPPGNKPYFIGVISSDEFNFDR